MKKNGLLWLLVAIAVVAVFSLMYIDYRKWDGVQKNAGDSAAEGSAGSTVHIYWDGVLYTYLGRTVNEKDLTAIGPILGKVTSVIDAGQEPTESGQANSPIFEGTVYLAKYDGCLAALADDKWLILPKAQYVTEDGELIAASGPSCIYWEGTLYTYQGKLVDDITTIGPILGKVTSVIDNGYAPQENGQANSPIFEGTVYFAKCGEGLAALVNDEWLWLPIWPE